VFGKTDLVVMEKT